MYIKRNYGFWMTFNWSKWPFIYGLLYSIAIFLGAYMLKVNVSSIALALGVGAFGRSGGNYFCTYSM
jgi:hypothetical protein